MCRSFEYFSRNYESAISMGIKFDDEIQGLFLLGSLPDSWETCRMSLSNSASDGVLSMDLVKSSVLNEEMRRKSQDSSSESGVLVTESRGRNMNQYSSNRDQIRSNSKKFIQCYNCGKKGHKQRFCWDLKKENEDKGKGKKKEEDSDGGSTNPTYDHELLLVEEHDIVDSASSWVMIVVLQHMSLPGEMFFAHILQVNLVM